MIRQRSFRSGVTLIEVLVALGVMAIGIVTLLSLFLLGAVQTAQAVKDDRTATLAANAETMAKVFWREAWQSQTSSAYPGGVETNEVVVFAAEPGLQALDNPGGGLTPLPTSSSAPSYPVFFDPIGVNTWSTANGQQWVGSTPGLIARRSWAATMTPPAPMTPTEACIRYCSVLDDMSFNNMGGPDTSNGTVDRGGRYSVGWMLQRRKNNVRSEVNLNVVVYQNRPPAVTPTQEYVFGATVNNGTTAVTLNLAGAQPLLKNGTWILDVSQLTSSSNPIPEQRADFYRIIGFTMLPGNVVSLELQTPVRLHPDFSIPVYVPGSPGGQYSGTFMILDNVVEVFGRGTISAIGAPAP